MLAAVFFCEVLPLFFVKNGSIRNSFINLKEQIIKSGIKKGYFIHTIVIYLKKNLMKSVLCCPETICVTVIKYLPFSLF